MHESLVLVTGGAGFIGSHVCDALLAAGGRVRCLDNFVTGRRENIAHHAGDERFGTVEADIRDARACATAVEGCTAVVHLAALGSVPRSIAEPLASEGANLTGFLNMLEACRHGGVKRFVYASSSSVYGDSSASPKREGQEGRPLSPYAVTKLMDEAYAHLYRHLFELEPIGLRFFNVFGERQDPQGPYAAAIPRFLLRLMEHKPPQVHGDGRQTRDFTHVSNAVSAVMAGLRCGDPRAHAQVFNIALGQRTDLLTLVEHLKRELAGHDPAVLSIPVEHVEERAGDVRHSLADVTRAGELLGWRPETDLATGLARTVAWYVRQRD
jgi:UDP-N-acetylglucosamine 4-epimerase